MENQSYLEEFQKNSINLTTLTVESFENEITRFDGVIICENSAQDTAYTCNILLKLKESTNVCVWVFSSEIQKVMRTIYLQLGVLGIISEKYEPDELQMIISNHLTRSSKRDFYTGDQRTLGLEKSGDVKV